jgi:fructose-1,6-bisphosphatase/inositol monophosphatase family enzyme
LKLIDTDQIADLIEETARIEIVPRFRQLATTAVFTKSSPQDPGDVVTEADQAAEARLGEALRAVLPGASIIGEEAAHADPAIVSLLGQPGIAWLIDPLDGTRNFVAGDERFGIMVALAVNGQTTASWIHLPMTRQTFVAEAGAGARLNGATLRVPLSPAEGSPAGTLYTRYMPATLRAQVEARAAACRLIPAAGCAALEYTSLALGRKEFVLYHRLHPWDHAAGALLLTEAGGMSRHPDGRLYRPTDQPEPTLLAMDEGRWRAVRTVLFPDGS